ncbi:unnamed protein product [Lactuca saligna]|uniref:Uncharacterized protein n=1 Tax=Lactuca saligna TaxID=75948 RepID=A0AA36E4D4_LACSI|nr:unnamed protein product [Lactuca saligna]
MKERNPNHHCEVVAAATGRRVGWRYACLVEFDSFGCLKLADVELEEEAHDIDVVEVDVKVEGEEDHVKMERERWFEVWKYYTRLPIGADGDEELCLQDLTEDVMKFDNNANGTHEEMESQA